MTTVSGSGGGGDAQRRLSPIKNAQKVKVKMQRTYFGLRLTSSSSGEEEKEACAQWTAQGGTFLSVSVCALVTNAHWAADDKGASAAAAGHY